MLRALPLLLLLLAACATPVAPTGGPADTVPPRLVTSTPAADSVLVRTDRLTLTFSKPIDEGSLRRAFSIVPDFAAPPRIVVRSRRAEIVFPDSLRPNTTYVVTIGRELRDLRNNALPAPITLAFSTGAQLDRGRIEGVVRDPVSGAGLAGMSLFAYALPEALGDTLSALPDPRTTAPDYRTETDTRGGFRLDYLREADFFVVAVEDRNRNRRADPGERFAVPRRPAVRATADTLGVPVLTLHATRADTLAPEPLRIRPLTERRFAVRFTEPVVLADRDPAAFALTDSLARRPVPIEAVYADEDPFQLVVRAAPMQPQPHRFEVLRPEAIRDTTGAALVPRPLTFTPARTTDEATPRLLAVEPAGADTVRALRPGAAPVLRFSEPPDTTALRERLRVESPAGEPLAYTLTSDDGVRYRVVTAAPAFRLRLAEPDTVLVRAFAPLPADSLGAVLGRVTDAPPGVPVTVELTFPDGTTRTAPVGPDGGFIFRALPAETVALRAFEDPGATGRWDGGLLAPYRPPARVRILEPVRVRPRWDTEIDPVAFDEPLAPVPLGPEDAPAPALDPIEPVLRPPADAPVDEVPLDPAPAEPPSPDPGAVEETDG